MARLIVGIRGDRAAAHSAEAPGDALQQTLELSMGDKRTIELRSEGVHSEDGTCWYWAEVAEEAAEDVAEQIRALPGVVSAFRQAPEGPP